MPVNVALAVASSLLSGLVPHAVPGSGPVEDAVWPLAPVPAVLAAFDPPATPWAAGHRGVDLAGSPGQPVLAARAGTGRWGQVPVRLGPGCRSDLDSSQQPVCAG